MNKLLITLIGAATLSATLPAIAAPDFQWLEQVRKNHRAQVGRMEKLSPEERCASQPLVLPLDHGPRPQTTPYENQLRKNRDEAQVKACKDAAK